MRPIWVMGTPAILRGTRAGGRSGEEELVVVAAMEGLGEGCGVVDREQSGVDLGGDAGFLADMGKISREAVAEVDGSRGQAVAYQPEALRDAGLGIEVRGKLGLKGLGNACRLPAGRLG